MTILRFYVDVRQSVANGHNCPVDPPIVEQDFDVASIAEAKRRLIASRLNSSGDVCSRREKDGSYSTQTTTGYAEPQERREEPHGLGTRAVRPQLVTAHDTTIDGLCAAIASEEEAIRTYAARKAAEEAAKEQGYVEKFKAVFFAREITTNKASYYQPDLRAWVRWASVSPDWPWISGSAAVDAFRQRPDVRAWEKSLEAESEANKQAAIDAIVAKREDEQRDRHEWIDRHGSQRLKRMAAEGIACEQTYQRERQQYETAELERDLAEAHPGWVVVDEDDVDRDVHDVSDRTLALLDAGRAMIADCQLARYGGRYVCVAKFRGKTIVWPRD